MRICVSMFTSPSNVDSITQLKNRHMYYTFDWIRAKFQENPFVQAQIESSYCRQHNHLRLRTPCVVHWVGCNYRLVFPFIL